MSIAVSASPSDNEIIIQGDVLKTSRRISLLPVGVIGFFSLATFLLAAVLFWAISILLGLL